MFELTFEGLKSLPILIQFLFFEKFLKLLAKINSKAPKIFEKYEMT